ncbi:MAG: hypothetical protein KY460_13750 [Actinobacteria bacterium]|nr:hypothetical protein [Actinomycetota bacterium]
MSDHPAEPPVDGEAQQHEEELLREHGVDPADPVLGREIRRLEADATTEQPFGAPGAPILERYRSASPSRRHLVC